MAADPIGVTVVGGYLGAGKTTIISRLLEGAADDGRSPQRIAVLVNDFGQVNIDAARIARRTDDVIELSNGCVCCALLDSFVETLDAILDWPDPPDHLVIEPSGVADPMSVAQYAYMPGFELAGVAVAVDMDAVVTQLDDKRIGPSIRRQIERADLILATKLDLAEDLADAQRCLAEMQTGPVLDVVDGYVDPAILLGTMSGEGDDDGRNVVTSRAPSLDTTPELESTVIQLEPLSEADRPALTLWLAAAPPSVLRAKGTVPCIEGGTFDVDLVGRRSQVIRRSGTTAGDNSPVLVLAEPGDPAVTEWLATRWPRSGEASRPSTES